MTPAEAAKGLGRAMRAHVKHGIGGATRKTLDALERRGLVQESERRPGYLEISPMGLCVRTLLHGRDPECLGDPDRVELRTPVGGGWDGPAEYDPCTKHPGNGAIFRWAWSDPDDGDHESAITDSEPVTIAGCPHCDAEAEAAYLDDCG